MEIRIALVPMLSVPKKDES